MSEHPEQITFDRWDERYRQLTDDGMVEPGYGGPLRRHVDDGDRRLASLKFDASAASLRLWNFLMAEEERLAAARESGKKIVGAMKDLGTVPVMAYSFPGLTAFYPDGAWWIPCVMELDAGLLDIAGSLGIDESFCPVRAMLGAFVTEGHFPIPDLLVCSVGAVCDDFSAIAQRLNGLGHPVFWWEIPHRRPPDPGEKAVSLPGGMTAPRAQVDFVRSELERVCRALGNLAGEELSDGGLARGISVANQVRKTLRELRRLVFTADICPLPSLELLIAEMLAIHFCSDREEALEVLRGLVEEVRGRVESGAGFFGAGAVRVFWVNPVADLRVMNLLEERGGRICGTEHLFSHAIDEIPTDIAPMEALARMALADPMAGSITDRAERICRDAREFGSEAVLISRIPGASHCALEGQLIGEIVKERLGIPIVEMEVPPVSDPVRATLATRLDALIETALEQR